MGSVKNFFTNALRLQLRLLARLTIARYRPGVVGVTGSAGKTSAKIAIAAVLREVRRVRMSSGNLNNDLGLPLAILGDWTPRELALVSRETPSGTHRFRKLWFWAKVIVLSWWRILRHDGSYPEVLILEYGADRPGDIRSLLRIVRPQVSVITAIGDTPVHVEFYEDGAAGVAREKARLIEALTPSGFAVLNADDETVMRLAPRTRGRVISYGFEKEATVRATRFEHWTEKDAAGAEVPRGITFKLEYAGNAVTVRIAGAFGKAHAYAATAAGAIGLIFGMNPAKIAEALQGYHPAGARMQLVPGIKHTWIIDDSYNASPIAMRSALETLRDLPAKRRIAVLGDMLEIGKYTPEAHEAIGRLAAGIADVLVTVGPRAKFIADAARKARMKPANIYSFDAAEDAALPLQEHLQRGDLVLIKGSHAMELNKVVDEVRYIEPSSSSPA